MWNLEGKASIIFPARVLLPVVRKKLTNLSNQNRIHLTWRQSLAWRSSWGFCGWRWNLQEGKSPGIGVVTTDLSNCLRNPKKKPQNTDRIGFSPRNLDSPTYRTKQNGPECHWLVKNNNNKKKSPTLIYPRCLDAYYQSLFNRGAVSSL